MARRKAVSPLAQIIRWFLGAGLAEAEQALETAQTIVEQKREQPVPPAAAVLRIRHTTRVSPPADDVATAPKPRQRARRSDAGKPRAAAVAAGTPAAPTIPVARVTRRRTPVAAAPAPVVDAVPAVPAVAGALPDSAVPEGEDQ